jgi:tetratricopeptide (TPR) repeat protein
VVCIVLPSAFAAPSEPRPGAASNTADTAASEIKSLQEQVRALDKDTAVNKAESTARLEAQDKRIADLALSTAQVGNQIAWTSAVGAALMTLFAILVGVFTYVGVTKRARAESREAAEKWLGENEKGLVDNINQLEVKAQELAAKYLVADTKIKDTVGNVETTADAAHSRITEVAVAADKLINRNLAKSGEFEPSLDAAQKQAEAIIADASSDLQQKPEATFSAEDHFIRALNYQNTRNFPAAFDSIELAIGAAKSSNVSDEILASYLLMKANVLYSQEVWSNAFSAYEELVSIFGDAVTPSVRRQVASALVNKGITLGQLGKHHDEIAVYEEVEHRYGKDPSTQMREQVAQALINKAITLGQLGMQNEEIAAYEAMVLRYRDDTTSGVREQVAKGLLNMGLTFDELGQPEKELSAYETLDQLFGKDETPNIREQVAGALFNKGLTLGIAGEFRKEIAVYQLLVDRYSKDSSPSMRARVAQALVNHGIALGKLGKPEEAIPVFDSIEYFYGQDTTVDLREQVAKALENKGVALVLLKQYGNAIALYEALEHRYGEETEPAFREIVAQARYSLGSNRVFEAKRRWSEPELRIKLISEARDAILRADLRGEAEAESEDRALLLGRLGYCEFLLNQRVESRQLTQQSLALGGWVMCLALIEDSKIYRIESEDKAYEVMLREIWDQLPKKDEPKV